MKTARNVNMMLKMINNLLKLSSSHKSRIPYFSIYENDLLFNYWVDQSHSPITELSSLGNLSDTWRDSFTNPDDMFIRLSYLVKFYSDNLYTVLKSEQKVD